mgnify:CR=1 FL=1
MTTHDSNGFWEGGERAWWRGLNDAIKAAKRQLKTATTDDERTAAQSRLDELKRQEVDANKNGDDRLY